MYMMWQEALGSPLPASTKCSKVGQVYLVTRLTFIEFSSKGTVIFVAGGQENSKDGAAVAAVRFSSNIKLINEYKIKDAGDMIHSIKRHENGNILFVGAKSKVVILFFDGTTFETVAEYSNLPLQTITHFQNLDEELYCASPQDPHMLKIIYASRAVAPFSKDKPKIERNILSQFMVTSKKTISLPSKLTWMKLGPQNKEILMKSLGKLYIIEKKEGKSVFDFSQAMKDTGIVFQDMLKLADGRSVVTLPHSNTLKLLTRGGEELTEIISKGSQSYHPSLTSLILSRSTDPHIFVWPMGSGFLGIIDLQRMEVDRVPGLGGLGEDNSLSHLMICAQNGSKVISVSHKNQTNSFYFSFWQKMEAGKTVTRSAEYVYPKRELEFT